MKDKHIDKERIWSKLIEDERMPKAEKTNRRKYAIAFLVIILIGGGSFFMSKDLKTFSNREKPALIAIEGNDDYKINDDRIVNIEEKRESIEFDNISGISNNLEAPSRKTKTFKDVVQNEMAIVKGKEKSYYTNQNEEKLPLYNAVLKVLQKQTREKTSLKKGERSLFSRNERETRNSVGINRLNFLPLVENVLVGPQRQVIIENNLVYTEIKKVTDQKTYIYAKQGLGFVKEDPTLLDRESQMFLDSFNRHHSSFLSQVGIQRSFGKWSCYVGLNYELHEYSGMFVDEELDYQRDQQSILEKRLIITNYNLFQKYAMLGLDLSLGYDFYLKGLTITPNVGVNVGLLNLSRGKLIDQETLNLLPLGRNNVKVSNLLSLNLGLNFSKSISDRFDLTTGLQWNTKRSYEYNSNYKLDISSSYISVGLRYKF